MHDRRRLALGITLLGAIAIVASPLVLSIVRGPAFHHYAGSRVLLVLSNVPFLIVAAVSRGAPWYLRAGVAAIGIGSGAYHAQPSDMLLALDWAPIVVTLLLLVATVADHRAAFAAAPALALGSVAFWLGTGGTQGGNMAPYVTAQGCGVLLPSLLAVLTPGRAHLPWLLAGLAGFALARAANLYDHSLKHVLAACAAWCALRAVTGRSSSSP